MSDEDARQTISAPEIAEGSSAYIEFPLTDEHGDPMLDPLSTITLKLYRDSDDVGVFINSRNNTNVNNLNGGTVPGDGTFGFQFTPEDAVLAAGRPAQEVHEACFDYTWAGGLKKASKIVRFTVYRKKNG